MNVSSANAFASLKSNDVNSMPSSSFDSKANDFKNLLDKASQNNKNDNNVSDKTSQKPDETEKADNNSSKTDKSDKVDKGSDKTTKKDKAESKKEQKTENVQNQASLVQNTELQKPVNDLSFMAAMVKGNFVQDEAVNIQPTETSVAVTSLVQENAAPILSSGGMNENSNVAVNNVSEAVLTQQSQELTKESTDNSSLKVEVKTDLQNESKVLSSNQFIKTDDTAAKKSDVEVHNDNKENVTNVLSEPKKETVEAVKTQTKTVVNEEVKKDNISDLLAEAKNNVKSDTVMPKIDTNFAENVNVKVGDTILDAESNDFDGKLAEEIIFKTSKGTNEFEVELSPKNLGKITIKVLFEDGHATVSMLCSNSKTLSLLNENASNIGAIIQNNTGSQTTVNIQEDKSLYEQQKQNSQGGNQQQQNQENQKNNRNQNSEDFIQQLRLGIVNINDFDADYSF